MVNLGINGQLIRDVKLVIFDKDGTLMELYTYWSQMVGLRARLICQKMNLGKEYENGLIYNMGVDVKAGKLRPEGPVGILKREIVLQAAVDYLVSTGHMNVYDTCFEAFEVVDSISSTNLQQFIKPIAGARELVELLSNKGCKVVVATTDRTDRARLAMEFLGFGDKINLVIGADMVKKAKPDPEMVYMVLECLKIDKSNAVMVGDAITDIQMGLNAGLKASIGVLTGLTPAHELRKITHFILDDISKIAVLP